MKTPLVFGMILLVAACGRHERFEGSAPARVSNSSSAIVATPGPLPPRVRLASGPISNACKASDRKARSNTLCGCIQAVADQTLSGAQQREAASFYKDPHKAQEIRQSKRASHERFWEDYVNYAEQAKRICT